MNQWAVQISGDVDIPWRPDLAWAVEATLADHGAVDPTCTADADTKAVGSSYRISAAGSVDATRRGRSIFVDALEELGGVVTSVTRYAQAPVATAATTALLGRIGQRNDGAVDAQG